MATISLILTLCLSKLSADPCPTVEKIRIGAGCESLVTAPLEAFDHAPFHELLARFVDCQGLVHYAAWKADCDAMAQLQAYLESLGGVSFSPDCHGGVHEKALLINAYNALCLYGVLREYPVPSIQVLQRRKTLKIMDDLEVWVDGDWHSLNAIEHDRLRPMGDPRIHFALVCGAKSCPRLRNEAYRPETLDEQLDANARHFFSQRKNFAIFRATGKVRVSTILKWFHDDFGACDRDVLARILPHLCPQDQAWLAEHPCAKLTYAGYDWGLNDKCPTLGVALAAPAYLMFAKVEPLTRPFRPKKVSNEASSDIPPEEPAAIESVGPPLAPAPTEPHSGKSTATNDLTTDVIGGKADAKIGGELDYADLKIEVLPSKIEPTSNPAMIPE